jgi:hypothetical protein
MKYETTYRAWVYSIAALTDAGRRKYVMVHLHAYLPGETSIELTGEPLEHPRGIRCSEVVLERSAALGLSIGNLVDVEVALTPANVTTRDQIQAARRHGLKAVIERQSRRG